MDDKFDRSEWDGSAVKANLPVDELRRVCLLDLNGYPGQEGDAKKELCKLPIKKTPDSPVNINALRAAGSGSRGIAAVEKPEEVPEEYFVQKRRQAARELASLWEEAFDNEAPESVMRFVQWVSKDSSVLADIDVRLRKLEERIERLAALVEEVHEMAQFG